MTAILNSQQQQHHLPFYCANCGILCSVPLEGSGRLPVETISLIVEGSDGPHKRSLQKVSVKEALLTIYHLTVIEELNAIGMSTWSTQKMIVCELCSLALADLYKLYVKFDRRRNANTLLTKRIEQLNIILRAFQEKWVQENPNNEQEAQFVKTEVTEIQLEPSLPQDTDLDLKPDVKPEFVEIQNYEEQQQDEEEQDVEDQSQFNCVKEEEETQAYPKFEIDCDEDDWTTNEGAEEQEDPLGIPQPEPPPPATTTTPKLPTPVIPPTDFFQRTALRVTDCFPTPKCPLCKAGSGGKRKRLKNPESFIDHIIDHVHVAPGLSGWEKRRTKFACPICHFQFLPQSMKYHVLVHVRRLQCLVYGCKLTFQTREDLIQHAENHPPPGLNE